MEMWHAYYGYGDWQTACKNGWMSSMVELFLFGKVWGLLGRMRGNRSHRSWGFSFSCWDWQEHGQEILGMILYLKWGGQMIIFIFSTPKKQTQITSNCRGVLQRLAVVRDVIGENMRLYPFRHSSSGWDGPGVVCGGLFEPGLGGGGVTGERGRSNLVTFCSIR